VTISLTETAYAEILRLSRKQGEPKSFRLGVQAGGCSGLIYTLNFHPTPSPDDRQQQWQDIRILIDSSTSPYCQNLTLDYAEDLMGGNFRFNNPTVSGTCNCGNSFLNLAKPEP
jgi:iron-sulfur cluster assembly accessory protein